MNNRSIFFRWLKDSDVPWHWLNYLLQGFIAAILLKMWKKRSKDLEARWMW